MENKKCLKCQHTWLSRVENPRACPNCKSVAWSHGLDKRRERRKYPFYDLQLKEVLRIPGKHLPDGYPDVQANGKVWSALTQWERRSGRKHAQQYIAGYLVITRIL